MDQFEILATTGKHGYTTLLLHHATRTGDTPLKEGYTSYSSGCLENWELRLTDQADNILTEPEPGLSENMISTYIETRLEGKSSRFASDVTRPKVVFTIAKGQEVTSPSGEWLTAGARIHGPYRAVLFLLLYIAENIIFSSSLLPHYLMNLSA